MNTLEAVEICEAWFKHIEEQRARSVHLQELATKRRRGEIDDVSARRAMAAIDRAPRVFDGARLEPAVRHLVALAQE